jgi:MFS family permease
MIGRKKTILLGTTIMSVGAILQITAYGVPHMIVGRKLQAKHESRSWLILARAGIVAGVGNGLNTSTAPPWQAETSKAAWRGKLIVIELVRNIMKCLQTSSRLSRRLSQEVSVASTSFTLSIG